MINNGKFAQNIAGVSGVVYIACALFVALFPGLSLSLMSALTHLNLSVAFGGGMRVAFGGFISGLIQVLLYSYVLAHLFAWALNRSAKH